MYTEKFLVPTSLYVIENQSNDIELVGIVTIVTDVDTLDISGIRIRLVLVDTSEINQQGYESKGICQIVESWKEGRVGCR